MIYPLFSYRERLLTDRLRGLMAVFRANIVAQEAVLKAKENQARAELTLYREIGKFLLTSPSEKMNQIIAMAITQVQERNQDVFYPSLTGDSNVHFTGTVHEVSPGEVSQFENAAASHLKDVQAKLNVQPVVVPVDYGPTVGED